jgi:nicotinamide-nucleotide amidase
LADVAHGRLVETGRTVAVAESLTGGLICAMLTAAPATRVTFRGGLVVYATDLKHTLAGVEQRALNQHGPVHAAVAEQLARGARQRLDADYGVGVTGVAGPGEQDGHPVGELFTAVAAVNGTTVQRHDFSGTRQEIRMSAVVAALSHLLDVVDSD